jgi:hypothetical protein
MHACNCFRHAPVDARILCQLGHSQADISYCLCEYNAITEVPLLFSDVSRQQIRSRDVISHVRGTIFIGKLSALKSVYDNSEIQEGTDRRSICASTKCQGIHLMA